MGGSPRGGGGAALPKFKLHRRTRWLLGVALAGALAFGAAWLVRPAPDPPGRWRVVLDLAAQLERARRYHLPEYDVLGSPDPLPHLESRWNAVDPPGQVRSDYDVGLVWLPGVAVDTTAEFEVEADWKDGAVDRSVRVVVNKQPLESVPANGRTRHKTRIPAAVMGQGEHNYLQFSCAPGCAGLGLYGLRTSVAVTDAERASPFFPLGSRASGERIEQLAAASLTFAARPPAGAHLWARLPPLWKQGPARYAIQASTAVGQSETLARRRNPLLREGLLDVPLDRFNDRPVRLRFEVRRLPGAGAYPVAWLRPRIVVPDLEPAAPRASPRRLPNVVVYVMDALRADHLEPYGYARDTSPEISRFAAGALLFEHAYSQSVWTKPSVGSLLSGLYPEEHLAVDDATSLGPEVRLITSHLKRLGYSTLALQSNGNAGPRYGFERDFDRFVEIEQPAGRVESWNTSTRVQALLAEALPRLREPYFIFIQALDTHYPYSTEGEYARYLKGHPYEHRGLGPLWQAWAAGTEESETVRDLTRSYLEALYDGALRHNDRSFGQMLQLVAAQGQADRTAVILTADHGEAFKEHGWEVGHATLFEGVVHVPLIVRPPGGAEPLRVPTPVQHVDLAPTILEWAGLAKPAELPGTSLVEIVRQGTRAPTRSIHVSVFPDRQLGRFPSAGRAVVSWPHKLIHSDTRRAAYYLSNLETDPAEKQNLWRSVRGDAVSDFLLAELRSRPRAPTGPTKVRTISPEDIERLRALGYIQ